MASRYCQHCGTALNEGAKFCHNCGIRTKPYVEPEQSPVLPSKPTSVLDGYLTMEQLAEQLGKSTRTIARWESARIGPPYVKVGGMRLYRIDSVCRWLDSRQKKEVR